MGMYDIKNVINAKVVSNSYMTVGIHHVKFTGVDKGENPSYNTIEFTFEDINDGSIHHERLFEPTSGERQANRFNPAISDPSQAEQFMAKLMHIIAGLDPENHQKIKDGTLKFAPTSFDNVVNYVKKLLTPKIGSEIEIKLVPNGKYAGFPGFPARLSKDGVIYLTTSFIGHNLTLTPNEKSQIDKALAAKPTDMTKVEKSTGSEDIFDLSDPTPVDNSELNALQNDVDDPDDLPF